MAAGSDLGTIVRERGTWFVAEHATTFQQRKALRAIAACRTPALGGTRHQCDHCGHEHIVWHSCRHRGCPQCGAAARAAWLAAREAELLAVPYFHVVFTVPDELNVFALHAPAVFYDLLFRAAGATLTEIGASRLDARLGALAVLHTWTQTLLLHPHVHCVVPGGGFSLDGSRWKGVRKPTFFLPFKVLSRRFRTNLTASLVEAWGSGKLNLPEHLLDQAAFHALIQHVRAIEWVVYAKPPFAGPACVLRYLANYTHRIAISNSRIVSFDGHSVTFNYRDSVHHNATRSMTLAVDEFLRRFLLHVLPPRLVRIRYYGFLANRLRSPSLARARALIGSRCAASPTTRPSTSEHLLERCPRCGAGHMHPVGPVDPMPVALNDSS